MENNNQDAEADSNAIASWGYEANSLRGPQSIADLGRDSLALHHIFGADMTRRGGLFLIEDDVVVYAVSAAVVFENTLSGTKEYLLGIDDAGVGSVTIHPSRQYFAVGGKGNQPRICIYSYPNKKLMKVLKGGAERGYACMSFNSDGDQLASVSMAPDFMLTIWDWRQEQMGLHAKAFGQDVFNVRFSRDDPRRLTTSGTGHIRFWKMAATFTGLKLQGSIGKFGKIDLSDIDNFVELPDGKVVSGTESGSLLLWEGNFIKCRFVQTGGLSCHRGNVTYVEFDKDEKVVITAAVDGFIRWWDFTVIDSAEVDSDQSMDFELEPIAEFFIGEDVGVKAMLDSGPLCSEFTVGNRFFVILDTSGQTQVITFSLFVNADGSNNGKPIVLRDAVLSLINDQLDLPDEADEFMVVENYCVNKRIFNQFHSGEITGIDTCPIDHLVATCSTDGTVRCLDYLKKKEVACSQFLNLAATSLRWLPTTVDPSGRSIVVGFSDGTVRVLGLAEGGEGMDSVVFIRKMACKPHNAAVVDLAFNASGTVLATAGKDGKVFFLRSLSPSGEELNSYWPLKFVAMNSLPSSSKAPVFCERLTWSPNDANILCVCSDGVLREVDLYKLLNEMDSYSNSEETTTFEGSFPLREIVTKIPVLSVSKSAASLNASVDVKSDDKSVEEAAQLVPLKTTKAMYALNRSGGSIVTASTANQKSYLFECDISVEIPLRELSNGLYSSDGKEVPKNPQPTACRYSWSKKFLLIGTADGSVIVRPSEYLETFMRAAGHSNTCEGVSCIASSFDDRFVLSGSKDSTVAVFRVRLDIVTARASTLFKDVEAGVFGSETAILPPPAAEPEYMSRVTSDTEALENHLFAPLHQSRKPENILQKVLLKCEDEEKDIAPGAYSIQDNSLKLEEDAKKNSAEDLKSRVRSSVRTLQRDYQKVMKEMVLIPEQVRPKPDEILVDKEYFDIIEEKGRTMIDEVHKECAYETEKAEKLLSKITSRMMEGLLVEEIKLSAFDYPGMPGEQIKRRQPRSIVKSLRAKSLDPRVEVVLKDVQNMVREAEFKEAQLRANETAQRKAMETVDEMKKKLQKKESDRVNENDNVDKSADVIAALSSSRREGSPAHESTAVIRREKRKERKEQLIKHFGRKPSEDADDIRDLQAIKIAEKTIGDYKLKVADDYEVPEDQRINAVKKIRQMALLEESMLKIRLQFDERFFALRQLKREIIYSIRRDNARIRAIDNELGQSNLSNELWEPRLNPDEFPDDADEVTEAELLQFKALRDSGNSWEKIVPTKHAIVTGTKTEIKKNVKSGSFEVVSMFHNRYDLTASADKKLLNFLSDAALVNFTPERQDLPKYYEVNDSIFTELRSSDAKKLQEIEQRIPFLNKVQASVKNRMIQEKLSKIQQKVNRERMQKLEFERKMLLEKIQENVTAFQEAIDELRLDRHMFTSDLKLAELKLLTLYQEYKLLQTFETKDNTLQQKQIRCKGEEAEILAQFNEGKNKLETKVDELRHWNEKLAQLSSECKALLPDNHPYMEPLTKIFKKKVKRSKGDGGDNDDEEEEENDEDDDDDDDEEADDICPPGCDQVLFEKILELREKKTDTEEITGDIQKGIDEVKKSLDRLKQREKQIAKDTQQTEMEVQQFQLQKQAALNQIAVAVPLKVSQLYMFESSGVFTGPTDGKPSQTQVVAGAASSAVDDAAGELQEGKESNGLISIEDRRLVTEIDMRSHVLFTEQNLVRLKERINELHVEIENAKDDFKLLHKERGLLLKECEHQKEEIQTWSERCTNLQMLKFGRVIDLDELEAKSDRSKETEAENLLKEDENNFKIKMAKLAKETADLNEQLFAVTTRNTKLLNDVAELTDTKLNITRELNQPQSVAHTSKLDNFREAEETKRIAAYIKFQANELDSLRTELNMLKRKEAPPLIALSQTMPSIAQHNPPSNLPYPATNNMELVLPPIPNLKH